MKYFLFNYGCQMNTADSEKIDFALRESGYQLTQNPLAADLIVINACSVRQTAVDRIYGQINNFPDKKILLSGCLLEFDKKRLSKKRNIKFWEPNQYFDFPPNRPNKFTAYVPIMTGCDNFCSYCVVPYTRGREKSRPAAEIIKETKSLIKKGCREIILLGQNVNSYYPPNKKMRFPDLLEKINNIGGDFWLSFLTSHPKDMTDDLIETIARCKKVAPHIHLPVQSGDNEILKKMNRHYTVAHYKNLIKKIRAAFSRHRPGFPPLAISTDIIVGFPNETKKQFKNTLKLIRDVKFDMIYFAQYSPRPGTAAAKLTDNVPPKEKKRRAESINALLGKNAEKINKKYLNKTLPIFIYEIKRNFAVGKTATNKDVKVPKTNLGCGDLVPVKIIKTSAWGFKGKL